MSLTHSDIAEIIRLVDQSTLDEFVVEIGDLKVEDPAQGSDAGSAERARGTCATRVIRTNHARTNHARADSA